MQSCVSAFEPVPAFYLEHCSVSTFNRVLTPSDCIVAHSVDIVIPNEEGHLVAGVIDYSEIKLSTALNRGFDWEAVLCGHSEEGEHLFETLMGSASPNYYPDFNDETLGIVGDITGCDILWIHSAEVAQHTLGLAALETLIDHTPCALVVVSADPMDVSEDVPQSLQRVGFKKLGASPFLALNTAYLRPSVSELH